VLVIATLRSAADVVDENVPVELQPLSVTTTLSVIAPVEPTVKVIDGVLAPAVIVPPVMDQA